MSVTLSPLPHILHVLLGFSDSVATSITGPNNVPHDVQTNVWKQHIFNYNNMQLHEDKKILSIST